MMRYIICAAVSLPHLHCFLVLVSRSHCSCYYICHQSTFMPSPPDPPACWSRPVPLPAPDGAPVDPLTLPAACAAVESVANAAVPGGGASPSSSFGLARPSRSRRRSISSAVKMRGCGLPVRDERVMWANSTVRRLNGRDGGQLWGSNCARLHESPRTHSSHCPEQWNPSSCSTLCMRDSLHLEPCSLPCSLA